MGMEAGDLRREVAALGRRSRGERLPVDLRARLIRHARERPGRGDSLNEIARSVGVSMQSISRWTTQAEMGVRARALVPVVVRASAAVVSGLMTLHAPGGYRIENLSVAAAAELLRGSARDETSWLPLAPAPACRPGPRA